MPLAVEKVILKILKPSKYKRLKVVFGDSVYGLNGLLQWFADHCKCILQTILRPVNGKGFVVPPKRWIVERTFAWISRHRRTSKGHERRTENSKAVLYMAMIGFMAMRLAKR